MARDDLLISRPLGEHPGFRYHLFAPSEAVRRLVVVVHGRAGKAPAHLGALRPYARQAGVALVAPEFRRPWFRGYQRLAGRGRPLAAAAALAAAVADAGEVLGFGDPAPIFDLVGFSGGAQFAHRYALLFPERVRRVVAAAAGWYTRLDPDRAFPHGVGASESSGGVAVDVDAFLRIPLKVMVGEQDVGRDRHLRISSRLDREQGVHRLSRALRWVDHVGHHARRREITPAVSFELLPRAGHSFREAISRGDFGTRAFAFLETADAPPTCLGAAPHAGAAG